MVTSKKIVIPIYNFRLDIIVYDNWNEISYIFDNGPEPLAVTKSLYGKSIVAINSRSRDSIVHESLHIMNDIWEYIGYSSIVNNDEVDAYLITYIYKKIIEVFDRHHMQKGVT